MSVPPAPIQVLVVDDSRVIQGVLRRMLSRSPDIEVVDTADDAIDARVKLVRHRPEVLILDINMPGISGLALLEELMARAPMPVIVLSSLTPPDGPMTRRALAAGAAAVVQKPETGTTVEFQAMLATLERTILRVARSRRRGATPPHGGPPPSPPPRSPGPLGDLRQDLPIFIGASTGGPPALRELLGALPPDMPPIVIAQHMPSDFTKALARRLDAEVALEVVEARSGDPLVPGRVLIAPGHMHLKVRHQGPLAFVHTVTEIPGHLYRPSVDVLLRSAAAAFGSRAIGAVLTGMGSDGAQGLLAMRQAGARTIAQDEASSTIFGMPRAAVEAGAAGEVLGISQIAARMIQWLSRPPARTGSGG